MAQSKMFSGSSLLLGDNTIPGVKIPKEFLDQVPKICQAVKDLGCDYFEPILEFLTYDEMCEIAAYGGFPVRYPHWKWGMEYTELSKGYEHSMFRIYEMVINNNPSVIYFLDSNTLVDNVTVLAHALGHSDFFKNNVHFKPTNKNMLNKMANHASRVRKYSQRWGKDKVSKFIDHVLKIETLIDPVKGWAKRKYRDPIIRDERKFQFPRRRPVDDGHEYMDDWLNPRFDQDRQWKRIREEDARKEIEAFGKPEKDVFGFIKENAPLKPWQHDIICMLYDESLYFAPQRSTKVANEGFASFVDSKVMADMGLVSAGQKEHDTGIVHYAYHKMGVLGGKYSTNPYKLGYTLLCEIEDRWNKGRFGREWEECTNIRERERWDKKTNLGLEKVFDVRAAYNDIMLIQEFFDQDFCNKHEWFEWAKFPNGETQIVSRDAKKIKEKLIRRHLNGGLPDVRVTDDNFQGKGILCLQHYWDGRPLLNNYVKSVMSSLYSLWTQPVIMATKTRSGEEKVYICKSEDADNIELVNADELSKELK